MNIKIARILLTLSVPVAFLISVYGRLIQNFLGDFARTIPLIAVAILGVGIFFVAKSSIKEQLKALGLFLLYIVLIELLVVRWVIVEDVERIHFLKYGIIAYLAFLSQRASTTLNKRLFLSILFSAGLGTLEEGVQHFVPSRVFDLRDIAFNVTGACLGALYCKLRYPVTPHEAA